jgi:hydrogenase maturation protease
MKQQPFLAVCCGNADRGDDAAGPLVAGKLLELGVPVVVNSGDALDLLDQFEQASRIVLVDAVRTGAPPGTIFQWDARYERIPGGDSPASGHSISVSQAVELARILDCLPECTVYGIEAGHFEQGEPPTHEVLAAVDVVAMRVNEGYHRPDGKLEVTPYGSIPATSSST